MTIARNWSDLRVPYMVSGHLFGQFLGWWWDGEWRTWSSSSRVSDGAKTIGETLEAALRIGRCRELLAQHFYRNLCKDLNMDATTESLSSLSRALRVRWGGLVGWYAVEKLAAGDEELERSHPSWPRRCSNTALGPTKIQYSPAFR